MEKTPVELTGKQLNTLHYILSMQKPYIGANEEFQELVSVIYDGLKRSGYQELQRELVRQKVEKFLASKNGREWRKRYDAGRAGQEVPRDVQPNL